MNTAYFIDKALDTLFGASQSYYIGLSSTAPQADGTGVSEPTGGRYRRIQVDFSTPLNGSVTNKAAVIFPASTNEWFPFNEKATHWVMFDGTGSDAHVLVSGALSEPTAISIDMSARIDAGQIVITLADAT